MSEEQRSPSSSLDSQHSAPLATAASDSSTTPDEPVCQYGHEDCGWLSLHAKASA